MAEWEDAKHKKRLTPADEKALVRKEKKEAEAKLAAAEKLRKDAAKAKGKTPAAKKGKK